MRDLGTPRDRFRRAVNAGSLPIAEAALREMGAAGLPESLEIVALMAKTSDPRYERAAARWVALLAQDQDLPQAQVRQALAMVELLPHAPALLDNLRRLTTP